MPSNEINCKKAKPRKPWINDEILSLISQRNKLDCQYLDNPSEVILNEFKELRNYVNNSKEMQRMSIIYSFSLHLVLQVRTPFSIYWILKPILDLY